MKNKTYILYTIYFCIAVGVILIPFDLNVEPTTSTIIIKSIVGYSKILFTMILINMGILSYIRNNR